MQINKKKVKQKQKLERERERERERGQGAPCRHAHDVQSRAFEPLKSD